MEIIDNFLSKDEFKRVQGYLMSTDFPWYFNDYTLRPGGSGYQFTHTFLSGTGNGISSDFFSVSTIDEKTFLRIIKSLSK